MQTFYAALNGVNFRTKEVKALVRDMLIGDEVTLVRDAENVYDSNAIKVNSVDGTHLGFVEKEIAAEIAPLLDAGAEVKEAKVASFLSEIKPHLRIEVDDEAAVASEPEAA